MGLMIMFCAVGVFYPCSMSKLVMIRVLRNPCDRSPRRRLRQGAILVNIIVILRIFINASRLVPQLIKLCMGLQYLLTPYHHALTPATDPSSPPQYLYLNTAY